MQLVPYSIRWGHPLKFHCVGQQIQLHCSVNSGGLETNMIWHQGKDSWSYIHRIYALPDSKRHLQPRIWVGQPQVTSPDHLQHKPPVRIYILHTTASLVPRFRTASEPSTAFISVREHVSTLKARHMLTQVKSKYEKTKEQNPN